MQEQTLERMLEEAADEHAPDERAPSRLKSRIYSRLMRQHAAAGPLLGLSGSRAAGRPLCVFEALVDVCPTGETINRLNVCRVCHARVIAERVEEAPIYWHNCPYVTFQKR
jgi:hypothetical protein